MLTATLRDLKMIRSALADISKSSNHEVATGHIRDLISAEYYDEIIAANIRFAKLFTYSTSQVPIRYVTDEALDIPKRYQVRNLLTKVLDAQSDLLTIGKSVHTDSQLELARLRVLKQEQICKRMGLKSSLYSRPEYIKNYLSQYLDDLGYILQK